MNCTYDPATEKHTITLELTSTFVEDVQSIHGEDSADELILILGAEAYCLLRQHYPKLPPFNLSSSKRIGLGKNVPSTRYGNTMQVFMS